MAEINFLMSLLYGHGNPMEGMDERGPTEVAKAVLLDDGTTPTDWVGAFLAKNERDRLAKTTGLEDSGWDQPLAKAVSFILRKERTDPIGRGRAVIEGHGF